MRRYQKTLDSCPQPWCEDAHDATTVTRPDKQLELSVESDWHGDAKAARVGPAESALVCAEDRQDAKTPSQLNVMSHVESNNSSLVHLHTAEPHTPHPMLVLSPQLVPPCMAWDWSIRAVEPEN